MKTPSSGGPKPVLSLLTLTMINVATIGSIKNWPVIAEYGFSSVFFFLLAGLIFFIPTALASAELATGWPELGGVFAWVKEGFGHRSGFLAAWLLWIQNVVWYPTALSFIAATLAYVFNPELAVNHWYTFSVVIALFWALTWVNLKGMRLSGWISTVGMFLGTFIPGGLIILLGLIWFFSGFPLQITFSSNTFIPNMANFAELSLFTGVLLSLAGIEMSAVHAKDVINPKKNYPKAIFYGALLIFALSIPGILSIAIVVPQSEISLLAGSIQAIALFLQAYKLSSLTPLLALLVALGTIASVSTWAAGPTKALLAAAKEGDLPPWFRKVNSHQMPSSLMIVQALIVSILSLLFVFIPTLNEAFWILLVIVSELYLMMYLLLFATLIRLRYTAKEQSRSYQIPGKKVGVWLVALCGSASCLLTMVIGFIPPGHLNTMGPATYTLLIGGGLVVLGIIPFFILSFRSRSLN